MKRIQHIRTTRANLDSQKAANGLLVGEIYLITDENRIAVGIATNDYKTMSNEQDLGDIETLLAAL